MGCLMQDTLRCLISNNMRRLISKLTKKKMHREMVDKNIQKLIC